MSGRDECDDFLRKFSLKHKILGEFESKLFDDLSGILFGPNSNSKMIKLPPNGMFPRYIGTDFDHESQSKIATYYYIAYNIR